MKKVIACAALVLLGGCSDPHKALLSTADADKPKMQALMQKLPDEDRALVSGYIMRTMLAGAFSGKADLPVGMTVGDAIKQQKEWLAAQKRQAEEAAALKAKLQAERAAAEKKMNDAVTVTLVGKKLRPEYGYSGILMNEWLETRVGYQNNTERPIAGVKGRIVIYDIFDKEITVLLISNDDDILPGKSVLWEGSRSIRYGMKSDGDRKFADLPQEKYKVKWEPQVIVFKDGTKISVSTEN
jgi:hypothetical protein